MAFNTSARDARDNFNHAVRMLAIANTFRDADGNLKPYTKEQLETAMKNVDLDQCTQGYLQFSANLRASTQVVQFSVVDTQAISNSPITPIDRLLTMQDSFAVSSLSYFLLNYLYTGGNQTNINFAAGTWIPITYCNPYPGNGNAEELDGGCMIFWMGSYLSLEVNKKVLIPYWDCLRHYSAPQTQSTPELASPNPYQPNVRAQYDGSTDGYYPVEPNVVIGGGRGNILKLNLATNIPATLKPFSVSGYNDVFILKAVVKCNGVLLQNSTAVK